MKKANYLPILPAVAVAMLSACGGGGGGDTPAATTPTDTTISATLQGTASKGIVINGVVVANELNADGSVKNANVGSARTDSKGKYQLTTNSSYEGGPVEISISRDAETLMVCDAVSGCGSTSDTANDTNANNLVDFGEKYKPSSLNMSVMLPQVADGETVSAQITPFTHMAAQRARELAKTGSLDAATVSRANSAISTLIGGVNILSIEPVDITDANALTSADVKAIAYAALSAAVAELAEDDATTGEPDLDAQITKMSDDFKDGSFTVSELASIVAGAETSLSQTSSADTSGTFVKIGSVIEDAIANGGDVTPSDDYDYESGNSNLDLAYAFISDLRTWGTVIGQELDAPSMAFSTQIDLADQASSMFVGSIDAAMAAASDALNQFAMNPSLGTDLSQYTVAGGSFTAGTIGGEVLATGNSFTVTGAEFVTASQETATLSMSGTVPTDTATWEANTPITYGIDSLTATDAYSSISVTSGTLTFFLNDTYDPATAAPNSQPSFKSAAFDLQASLTQLKTLDPVNPATPIDAADPVTFTGTIQITAYPIADSNGFTVDIVPGSMTLAGGVMSQSGNSLNFNLTASLPQAAALAVSSAPAFAVGTTYADNNGGEHLVSYEVSGDTLTFSSPNSSLTATFNPGDSTVTVSSTYQGYDYLTGQYYPINDVYPDQSWDINPWTGIQDFINDRPWHFDVSYLMYGGNFIAGQGDYIYTGMSSGFGIDPTGYMTFILDQPDVNVDLSATPATIGLTFLAQFPGLPESTINISGSQTALDTGTGIMTISHGSRNMTINLSTDPGSSTMNATITNSDNVQLVITTIYTDAGNVTTGEITINNVKIADYNDSNGRQKVTYVDGTFEYL